MMAMLRISMTTLCKKLALIRAEELAAKCAAGHPANAREVIGCPAVYPNTAKFPMNCSALARQERRTATFRQDSRGIESAFRQALRRSSCRQPALVPPITARGAWTG